jgi:hypothetical protein
MFNRSYQLRAITNACGGHKVAADAAAHLPWAGIFETCSESWRPLVLTAAAAESVISKSHVNDSPHSAAKRCKRGSRQLQLFDGKLRGVQLSLFPDPPQNARESAADSTFPRLAEVEVPIDDDRPLFDLFPEAYL